MMTMRGELVIADTNVLLSATNTARPDHEASKLVFSTAIDRGVHLATCGQILREYLVVATRPVSVNGLGLALADALKNLTWFRKRMVFFEESEEVHHALVKIVTALDILGKRIHDANIAALMKSSGIRYLVTNNPDDFSGFPGIEVLTPGGFNAH
jgi:predicted nucleic acid-binding protein